MNNKYLVRNVSDLPSPALVFYEDIIRDNISLACKIAGNPLRLRPHVKTHKTAEIIKIAMEFGINRFKCATISEAEMLALAGAPDIFLAYPLFGKNAQRFAILAKKFGSIKFSTQIDSEEGLNSLLRAAKNERVRFGIFLDVDVGQHRTGIQPGTAAENLYAKASSYPEFFMMGLHCYDGHNHQHSIEERRIAAKNCYAMMESLRSPLLKAGFLVDEVVMGGTPTFPLYAEMPDVTLSPGTFVLHDLSYMQSFPDMAFTPAALIISRIVSMNRARNQFCIDLGYKGISADPQGLRGKLLNVPSCEPILQNEEHWVFSTSGEMLPLGSEVYVLPTHICPTVALYERAYIINNSGYFYKEWKIAARDRVVGV